MFNRDFVDDAVLSDFIPLAHLSLVIGSHLKTPHSSSQPFALVLSAFPTTEICWFMIIHEIIWDLVTLIDGLHFFIGWNGDQTY
jgi:hypothetical protein